jgi:L-threonylcarbamoyladenylate synthase
MPNGPASTPANFGVASAVRIADEEAIRDAVQLLRAGGLVAFPTETVYGLGADATNGEAVARIFEAKGRPHFNPLIVHVADLEAAEQLGVFSAEARRLAGAFWPGPLTLVVERKPDAQTSDLTSAGLPSLALRVPDHPVARALLRAAGRPLAAPSANRSGHVSATTARHVADDLGTRVSMILDGGPTAHGLESTILDVSGGQIALLRPGAIPIETIEYLLGARVERIRHAGTRPLAPGQLASHYAPRAAIRLNALACEPGEALLAFGAEVPATAGPVINLSPRGDLIEAAAALFSALRQLDRSGATTIAVMPIPHDGLGAAINDRLERAAAPRV